MCFPPIRRRAVTGLLSALVAGYMLPAVAQQAYPSKAIRFIVPYPPGGGTDIVARLLANRMSQTMGQAVVVDNKPGASTIIGTEMVARAAPDGYTIGLITDSHAINPSFGARLPYDSQKDFAPVTQLVSVPLVLVAHPKLKVRNLQEFLAVARARPGQINYASIGSGSPHYLAFEWLKTLAGVDVNHIPYKGVAPALNDLVAGQVDVMFTGSSSAAPYVKEGRLIVLGTSSVQRLTAFPTWPTIAESGLPDFDFMTWYGLAAPAGTPRPIVQRLNREVVAALRQPEVQERLQGLGVMAAPSSPEDFGEFIRLQTNKLARIIRATGAKAE